MYSYVYKNMNLGKNSQFNYVSRYIYDFMRDFHTTKVWIDQSIQISMNNIFTCFQSNNSENPKKKQIKNDKFLKVAPKNLKNSYPRHKIEKERDHRFYWKHQKIIENYVRCNNIWISAANCAVSGADSPWRSSAAETIAPS